MYDCGYCEANPYFFDVLGHDGPPAGMWSENLVNDKPLTICPRRTLLLANPEGLREVELYRLEIYPLYRKGHLMHEGGVGDQPARELAMMREFDRMTELAQLKYDELTAPDAEGTE